MGDVRRFNYLPGQPASAYRLLDATTSLPNGLYPQNIVEQCASPLAHLFSVVVPIPSHLFEQTASHAVVVRLDGTGQQDT